MRIDCLKGMVCGPHPYLVRVRSANLAMGPYDSPVTRNSAARISHPAGESAWATLVRTPSCHGGRGLDDKSASERVDDLDDGTETRVAFFVEALVEAFAADSGFLGDLAHAARLGYVANGGLQKRRVAGFRGDPRDGAQDEVGAAFLALA